MLKKISVLCLFLIMGSVTSYTLAKNLYKWKDAQGNIVFSDTSPGPGAQKLTILSGDSPPSQQSTTTEQQQNPSSDSIAQTTQEAPPEYQEKVKQACDSYRNNLQTLNQTGGRIYKVDESGEHHYYSDEQRQQEIQKLQEDIRQHCQ